jgi:winged helix DNA-binding protein
VKASRQQAIAYRVAAQGLDRQSGSAAPASLAVLDIGVQDSGSDAARLAFDARLAHTPAPDGFGPGRNLALVWSLRGAPHVHRRRDLDRTARALWPLSEQDATARLNETGPSVRRAGIAALEQWQIAVDEMRAVVTEPIAKGAASTAVSKRLPAVMLRDCRGCRAKHISDSAMRLGSLAAGVELEPGTAPPVLVPRAKAASVSGPDKRALRTFIDGYLRLLGPATSKDVAGYLDVRRADLEDLWPDDLVEVDVDGTTAWLPPAQADALSAVRKPAAALNAVVRLLGPFDPYLQARDRELIVPDSRVHKTLWPVLGRPGVVFAGGEVVGAWRTKSAKNRLTVTVEEFAPIPAPVWRQVEAEAERVAAVRGVPDVAVRR